MTIEELEVELLKDLDNAKNTIATVGKNIAIRFCASKGANIDWCNDLRQKDYYTVVTVAKICYGFLEKDEINNSSRV